MTLPENRFKSWMQSPPARPPLGSWLMAASPITAEAMGWAGFDWLVVDMEHTPIDLPTVTAMLQAVAGTPAEAVVRVPWNDAVTVKRVMDAGARTLMFPFVQSAEEARRAVAATRYPPEGVRGVAGMHRGSRFGTIPDYVTRANAQVAVIIQLETPEAVAALPEIAAVAGVDAVFTGPSDLSAAMGHPGAAGHAEVQAALRAAAAEARRLGIPCGIVGGDVATVQGFVEAGFSFVAIGSDLAHMMGAARRALADLRAEAPAPAAGTAY